MTNECQVVLRQALQLSAEERIALAVELIASIDGQAEADAGAAWAVEIEPRATRALAGQSTAQPWREALADHERQHRGRGSQEKVES